MYSHYRSYCRHTQTSPAAPPCRKKKRERERKRERRKGREKKQKKTEFGKGKLILQKKNFACGASRRRGNRILRTEGGPEPRGNRAKIEVRSPDSYDITVTPSFHKLFDFFQKE